MPVYTKKKISSRSILLFSLISKWACLLIFLAWQFFIFKNNQKLNMIFSGLSLGALAVFFIFSLITGMRQIKKFSLAAKITLGLTSVIWLVIALILNPGILCTDFFIIVDSTLNYKSASWHSNSFSSLVMSLGSIDQSFFSISLFFVFLYLLLIFRILSIFSNISYLNCLFFLVLFNLPQLFIFNFFIYRDVVLALLFGHLLVSLYQVHQHLIKTKIFNMQFWLIIAEVFILAIFVSLLKIDASLVLFSLLFFVFFITDRKVRLSFLAAFIAAIITFLSIKILSSRPKDYIYDLTGIWNPLSSIVYMNSEISPAQKEVLDKVVDLDYLENHSDVLFINGFHMGKYKANVSQKDWQQFVMTYLQLLFEYPSRFISNRSKMFIRANNIDGKSYLFQDQVEESMILFSKMGRALEIRIPALTQPLRKSFIQKLGQNFNEPDFKRWLFKSTAIYLAVGGLCLVVLWRQKLFWFLFFLILIRNVPVFLTAPEAHFKYYGSFLFPVLVFICLGVTAMTERKNEKITLNNR